MELYYGIILRNEIENVYYRIVLHDNITKLFTGLYYGIILRNAITGLYYGIILLNYITRLYYGIILWDSITRLYYGIILLGYVTELYYGIILRSHITELCYEACCGIPWDARDVPGASGHAPGTPRGTSLRSPRDAPGPLGTPRWPPRLQNQPYLSKYVAPDALGCCVRTCLLGSIAWRTPKDRLVHKTAAKIKQNYPPVPGFRWGVYA